MVRIVGLGDNDVDCYERDGHMYPGGNCFNVAVFASRFGAESAYVGAVADDPAGRLIRDTLIAEGVNVERLRTVAGNTAYCVIGHKGSDRIFLANDFGVSRFTPNDGDLDFVRGFEATHVYHLCGLDDWLSAIAERTRLSYDFSMRRDTEHRDRVARHCWLASVSASDLSVTETHDLLRSLNQAGAKWALGTRGSEGAVLSDGTTMHSVAAVPGNIVDTLGAGDAFIARVLVGLLSSEAPQAAMSAAAKEAAEACSYVGAVGHGVPTSIPPPARR